MAPSQPPSPTRQKSARDLAETGPTVSTRASERPQRDHDVKDVATSINGQGHASNLAPGAETAQGPNGSDADEPEGVDVYLPKDTYSFIAACGSDHTTAAIAFVICTLPVFGMQIIVLFACASQEDNLFSDGEWVVPWVAKMNTMGIKLVAIVLTCVKICSEFEDASWLYFALRLATIDFSPLATVSFCLQSPLDDPPTTKWNVSPQI
jgi:hypothetical protein